VQNLLKRIFTNDTFFALTTWCTMVLTIPFVIVVFFSYTDKIILMSALIRMTTVVCLAVGYIAYRKHSKNVMKGMIGATLMGYIIMIYTSFFAYENDILISAITVIFMIIFMVNHYIINSKHHSNPRRVGINQILGLFFAIVLCIEAALLVPDCVNKADTIVQILMCIAQPCAIFCIICIESRIDAYKINRETK